MKQRFTPLVLGLSMLGMVTSPAFAATTTTQQAQKISTLEKQVAELQEEMTKLKGQKKTTASKHSSGTYSQTAKKKQPSQTDPQSGPGQDTIRHRSLQGIHKLKAQLICQRLARYICRLT